MSDVVDEFEKILILLLGKLNKTLKALQLNLFVIQSASSNQSLHYEAAITFDRKACFGVWNTEEECLGGKTGELDPFGFHMHVQNQRLHDIVRLLLLQVSRLQILAKVSDG